MVAAHYSRSLYAVSATLASTFAACRVPQRDIPAEGNSGTLKVQMDNLATQDQGKPAFIYNLSGCLPEVSGVLQPKDTVNFTAPGVTNGLKGCKLQIKTAKQLTDRQFAQGGDPLVLYTSDLTDVFIDLDGELAAKAPLKKLYSNGPVGAQTQVQQQTAQPPAQVPAAQPPASTPDSSNPNDAGSPAQASPAMGLRLWQWFKRG